MFDEIELNAADEAQEALEREALGPRGSALVDSLDSLRRGRPNAAPLLTLLQEVLDEAPELYRTAWIPYLGGARVVTSTTQGVARRVSRRRLSWLEIESVERLQEVVRLLAGVAVSITIDLESFNDEKLAKLAASKHLEMVRALSIKSARYDKRMIDLLSARHLGSLDVLVLSNVRLGVRGARALAAVSNLQNLRRLSLVGCEVKAKGAAALASSSHLVNVRELALDRNKLDDAGVEALARSAMLTNLDRLTLSKNNITDTGCAAFTQTNAEHISWLDLSNNKIGSAGVAAIAGAPQFANLEVLDLALNKHITGTAAIAIANSPYMSNLSELNLYWGDIGVHGAEALAASEHVASLRKLVISNSRIRDVGLVALARSPNMANLVHLNLYACRASDVGVSAIAGSPHMTNLRYLDLSGNSSKFTAAGIAALMESPYLHESIKEKWRGA